MRRNFLRPEEGAGAEGFREKNGDDICIPIRGSMVREGAVSRSSKAFPFARPLAVRPFGAVWPDKREKPDRALSQCRFSGCGREEKGCFSQKVINGNGDAFPDSENPEQPAKRLRLFRRDLFFFLGKIHDWLK